MLKWLKNLFKKKKKKPEPFCRDCLLFDPKAKMCAVVILYNGEKMRLPVEADDPCFFENEFVAINDKGEQESFKAEVSQVKMWVEDKHGKKTDKDGTVKIEYPKGFFGDSK
jgi:hypothetical protein